MLVLLPDTVPAHARVQPVDVKVCNCRSCALRLNNYIGDEFNRFKFKRQLRIEVHCSQCGIVLEFAKVVFAT